VDGQDNPVSPGAGPSEEAAQVMCAGVLESAATALTDLVTSLRSAAAQIRGEPAPGAEHTCVMPRGAPMFTIYRCPCEKSWRLYPPAVERGAAQWREI
jgi:hypothetical protein